MSKPATVPVWASDATYTSGPETGNATVVTPSAGYLSQGWVPGLNFASQYANYIVNLLSQWATYLNLSGTDELTYAAARTRTVFVPLASGACNVPARSSNGDVAVTLTSGPVPAVWSVPVVLPHGATLTRVRAGVAPDAASNSGFMALTVLKQTPNTVSAGSATVATTLATTANPSVTAAAILSSGTLAEVIDNTVNCYTATVCSSASAGGTFDLLKWVEITYTETRATGHF